MSDKPRLLMVEDDPEMREEILVPGLRNAGFAVDGVGSAREAYRCLVARNYHLIVLDVVLPDEDGFTVAEHVRASTDAGVVLLSGSRLESVDLVRGLDEGADAYVAKPVDISVLVATLRSVLRRLEPQVAGGSASAWRLSDNGWNLKTPDGACIRLNHAERVLLDALTRSAGRPVARETVIQRLAGNGDVHLFDPRRLEMLVHRLRRKVLEHSGRPLPLSTVRGKGYLLLSHDESEGAPGH